MRTWVEHIDKPVCEITGKTLERGHIEERLVVYEATRTIEAAEEGDFEGLAYMLSNGVAGFYTMDDDDLLAEWLDAESGFYTCVENERLVYQLAEEDPIAKNV